MLSSQSYNEPNARRVVLRKTETGLSMPNNVICRKERARRKLFLLWEKEVQFEIIARIRTGPEPRLLRTPTIAIIVEKRSLVAIQHPS